MHNGESEFVAQEEFAQPSGYWWAPDDSLVAFKRYDDAPATLARRIEAYADRVEVVEKRYPAAGHVNALVRLDSSRRTAGRHRAPDRPGSGPGRLPARWIDWLPDGRHLAVQRLARSQQSLDLLFVDARSLEVRHILNESSPYLGRGPRRPALPAGPERLPLEFGAIRYSGTSTCTASTARCRGP